MSSLTYTGGVTIGSVSPVGGAFRDVRPDKEIEMIFEPGSSTNALISMKEHVYDTSGCSDAGYFCSTNEKQTKTHNYVVESASTAAGASFSTAAAWFSSSTVAAISETDFLYDSNYKTRNLNSLPTETRVKDPSGTTQARSQYSYDEGSYITSSSGSMPSGASGSWLDMSGTTDWYQLGTTLAAIRGLPTTVKHYYDVSGGSHIDTHTFFDQYGNAVKARDGRGNDTSMAFDASDAFVYPTSVTSPVPDSGGTYGSSSAFTTTTTYDYNTGRKMSVTDPNGLVNTYAYSDDLLRPTSITPKDGTGTQVGGQTVMIYGTPSSGVYPDAERYVRTKTQIDSTNWRDGYVWYDGLGRTIRTQKVDASPYGDDFVMTCYDSMGRVLKTTNPFRSYSSQTCSTSTGLDWTSTSYDALGRATSLTTPDTAHVDTAYSLADSGSQIGTAVTVTDQASKVRRSITNSLGQLIRVDEPTTSGLGSISSPNQPTIYAYSVLNNLTGVTQGSQSRSFAYDALSRLTSATNPESGTVGYTYDANSNLYTKTDARSITTTYTYDTLNRVTLRDYSDSTPDVTYYYDNVTNGKGKLKKVTSSVSATEYTSFDLMGRVTGHKQTTDSNDYATAYTYNLGGDLLEETYPSGRMVRNTIASDGSLSQVETKTTGSYATRAGSFVYTEAGAVKSLELGNSKYESTVFNNRLQPTQINLGTSATDTSLLHLVYTYETSGYHDNNGNVLTQNITVPGVSYDFVQAYTYDELNRIVSATETYNSSQNWKQEFSYDRYGNRNFVTGAGHTDTLGSCTTMCNPTFSSTTNRITSTGYTFDSSGNTTADPSGKTFVYDGENKLVSVSASGSYIGQYSYDGDGKRVKKTSSSDNTIFVYDASGRLTEEYPTSTPTVVATGYVYEASRLLSTETSSGTIYLTSDQLGSPRINTVASGSVVERHDYMPFGEEISSTQRTGIVGYSVETIRKQFQGYEQDSETGSDFAQARTFWPKIGRFSAPDPLLASAQIQRPQSFNRYAFVTNNPLILTDPSGLDWIRSITKNSDGLYTFTDATGSDLNKLLKSGDWTKVDFHGKDSLALLDKNGQAYFTIFAKGGGADIQAKPPTAANPVTSLVNSVTSDPRFQAVDRVTNPDGIALNAQVPLFGQGVSFTLTRNFDVVTAFSQGRDFWSFGAMARLKDVGDLNLLGGVTLQASLINESVVTHESRLDYYTNGSVEAGGCVRICGGVSLSPQTDGSFRKSFNVGVSAVSAPSAGINVNFASRTMVFNPHRAIFGQTYQTK